MELNQNKPLITAEQKRTKESFEEYSELDLLGRCGVALANLGLELMPDEEREAIGSIKPSGWHTVKHPEVIEDLYLYNRCHLIAFSLSGVIIEAYSVEDQGQGICFNVYVFNVQPGISIDYSTGDSRSIE